jgi:hypothetical protein
MLYPLYVATWFEGSTPWHDRIDPFHTKESRQTRGPTNDCLCLPSASRLVLHSPAGAGRRRKRGTLHENLLFAIREALLRSGRGEVKIDLPCGFEEILFTVGRHFTRNLARFRFIIR